jgi:hypothetical protein
MLTYSITIQAMSAWGRYLPVQYLCNGNFVRQQLQVQPVDTFVMHEMVVSQAITLRICYCFTAYSLLAGALVTLNLCIFGRTTMFRERYGR